jgi:DHHA1 domain
MGKLLREVTAAFGGRGGGQPELAQGGIASGSDLRQALQMAAGTFRQAGGLQPPAQAREAAMPLATSAEGEVTPAKYAGRVTPEDRIG